MPFDHLLTGLLGVAMALSPYSMAQPGDSDAHCDMGDAPTQAPDHESAAGCHAACTRDEKPIGRRGK